MPDVYKILDARNKIIWQKPSADDEFTPFTLTKADGIVFAYNSRYLCGDWKPAKNGFAWEVYSFTQCLAIPIAGYKYHPMTHVNGANGYGNSYDTHTLLNIPKGCTKVTIKWNAPSSVAPYIQVRLIAANAEGTLDSGNSPTNASEQSLNITFTEESWLIIRIATTTLTTYSTPESALGNYTIYFD